jgi:uncharacterized protein YjbJ (UPF0337 family)
MNRNQVKGGMKEAGGKVQKEFGKAVDSPKHTIKGAAKEVAGKTQKAVGDMQDESRRTREEIRREEHRKQ